MQKGGRGPKANKAESGSQRHPARERKHDHPSKYSAPRASSALYFRYHDQVTKHRQTQLDRRWGAAPRPLEVERDVADLGDLGAELEAAGVDEEHGGSVPAGHGLGLGLGFGFELGLGLGLGLGPGLGLALGFGLRLRLRLRLRLGLGRHRKLSPGASAGSMTSFTPSHSAPGT